MDLSQVDTLDLIIMGATVLSLVACLLLDPFLRFNVAKRRSNIEPDTDDTLSQEASSALRPITIILAPHDNSEALKKHLPELLAQQYAPGFQVVVVREEGDADTENVLKQIYRQWQEHRGDALLYITSIQESSRFMSRKKLAVTLGVKAASHNDVILMEPTCRPSTPLWLRAMASAFTENRDLLMPYIQWTDDAGNVMRYDHVLTAYYLMREAARSTAYRAIGNCIMFRKDRFIADNGYLGNLHLIRGEYDFPVNKFARKGNVAVALHPNAILTEDVPTKKQWQDRQLFYQETRRYMQRSFVHRMWFNADQLALYASLIIATFAVCYGLTAHKIIPISVGAVAWVICYVYKTLMSVKGFRILNEHIAWPWHLPLQLGAPWRGFIHIIKHRLADKYEFTTHKQ